MVGHCQKRLVENYDNLLTNSNNGYKSNSERVLTWLMSWCATTWAQLPSYHGKKVQIFSFCCWNIYIFLNYESCAILKEKKSSTCSKSTTVIQLGFNGLVWNKILWSGSLHKTVWWLFVLLEWESRWVQEKWPCNIWSKEFPIFLIERVSMWIYWLPDVNEKAIVKHQNWYSNECLQYNHVFLWRWKTSILSFTKRACVRDSLIW